MPFLHHTIFMFLISVVVLTPQGRERSNSQKTVCILSCQKKKKKAYPAIDFHFLCSLVKFEFLADSRSVLIIPAAPWVYAETLFKRELGSLLHQ